jgi:hypothetical protein
MADFVIAGTEFGIDVQQSRIQLTSRGNELLLTLEVHGNPAKFAAIKSDEDSKWSWALYPPHFYIRSYPVPAAARTRTAKVSLKPGDMTNYDIALYMMEHNDVDRVVVTLKGGVEVEVSGRVNLLGKRSPFEIRWSRP